MNLPSSRSSGTGFFAAQDVDDDCLDLLPKRVAELVQVVGLAAAMKLVELRGGGRLEVPKYVKPEHWLVEHIGLDALTRLVAYYGEERIEIDRCVKVLRMIKERAIVAEFDSGVSNGQLARKYSYTERGIRILRKRVAQAQPSANLDLFADLL
ncbi:MULTISPECIES: Mor transcription activator family protein [Methylobacter]